MLDSACRLARPMPPTPTAAMLTRSLGAMWRGPPRTWRGRIVSAAAAVAWPRNKRRELMIYPRREMRADCSTSGGPGQSVGFDGLLESDSGNLEAPAKVADVF